MCPNFVCSKGAKGIEEEAHEAGYQVIVEIMRCRLPKERICGAYAENGCIWIDYTDNTTDLGFWRWNWKEK